MSSVAEGAVQGVRKRCEEADEGMPQESHVAEIMIEGDNKRRDV